MMPCQPVGEKLWKTIGDANQILNLSQQKASSKFEQNAEGGISALYSLFNLKICHKFFSYPQYWGGILRRKQLLDWI
jgi:hypothetical protein